MTLRLIPDLLTHGDEALGLGQPDGRARRNGYAHYIGKANLRPPPQAHASPGHHVPSHAGALAVHEWLAHVAAGRIG